MRRTCAGRAAFGHGGSSTWVTGIDAARRVGWVAVVLADGAFAGTATAPDLAALVAEVEPVAVIGVDIPIGSVAGGRACDRLARTALGPRGRSVFPAPPAEVLDAADQVEANRRLAAAGLPRVSAQAWALVAKMRQATALAAVDERVHEVHPELAFATMTGAPMAHPKRTWAGQAERRAALRGAGVALPDDLGPAGLAAPDDVLDAAAVAWTAQRIAAGVAAPLPDPPEPGIDHPAVAIWA